MSDSWVAAFRRHHGRNPTAADLESALRQWGIEPKQDENGRNYYTRDQFEGAWRMVLDGKADA